MDIGIVEAHLPITTTQDTSNIMPRACSRKMCWDV